MSNIKNIEKLTKKELIIVLLKLESSTAKRNFEKFYNDNTDGDDTYDDKIRGIRMIVSTLGNIVNINDRKKFKKDFYEIERRKTFHISKKRDLWFLKSDG